MKLIIERQYQFTIYDILNVIYNIKSSLKFNRRSILVTQLINLKSFFWKYIVITK